MNNALRLAVVMGHRVSFPTIVLAMHLSIWHYLHACEVI